MDSETDLSKQETKGTQAKLLLDNKVLQDAFQEVENHFHTQMMNSQSNQSEFRDLCWRSIKVVKLVQSSLRNSISTGKAAIAELERIERAKSFPILGRSDPYSAII